MSAVTTRMSETWKRSAMIGEMFCELDIETPKSPVMRLENQSQYCTMSGRSVPSSARFLASSSGVALTPRAISAGSPGTTRSARKMRMEDTNTVPTNRATMRTS